MTDAATEARWDHDRDLRKHDTDPLPIRMSPPIAGALEVAILVKGLTSYADAAALIEQYAQCVASEAALQATITATELVLATIEVSHV